jgi:NAD(P)-dependent dehydrogenase (short-subunit alcohol dehydrogenase family)
MQTVLYYSVHIMLRISIVFILLGVLWSTAFGLISPALHFQRRKTNLCHEAAANTFAASAEAFLISQQPSGVSRESLQYMIDRRGLRENFVVVVTGATGGIGQSICQTVLAMNGLIVAVDFNEQALMELSQQDPDRIRTIVADFRDLNSVSAAADSILSQVSQIDIIVCNAGICYLFEDDEVDQAGRTEQGYDNCFQINYLGHFLLTKRLLKKMDAETARVVHVTSGLSSAVDGSGLVPSGDDDPASSRSGSDRLSRHVSMAYGNSKLAQIWYSAQLNRLGVTSVCACPSWAATGIAGDNYLVTELLEKLAFSPHPKNEGEVAGPAVRSILNAMFLRTDELNDDLLSGRKLIGNSRVFDTVFPQDNDKPNPIISFISRFVHREKFVKAFATYIVMLFQRWSHDDLIFQKNSYESKNEEGQIALCEWSEQAVSQWLELGASERIESTKASSFEERDFDTEDSLLVV